MIALIFVCMSYCGETTTTFCRRLVIVGGYETLSFKMTGFRKWKKEAIFLPIWNPNNLVKT